MFIRYMSLNSNKKITIKFVSIYLSLMTPILLLWYWSPAFALLFFLIYSAWHFGSTETIRWGIKNSFIGAPGFMIENILVCL